MTEQRLMKDSLDKHAVNKIAVVLSQTLSHFDSPAFQKAANKGLDKLELKQRVLHIISAMADYLPSDFLKTAAALKNVPYYWPTTSGEQDISVFAAWPIIDYVGEYGLEHPKISMDLLQTLTPMFSAEFAIRAFIINHPKISHEFLAKWCTHKNEHVRRLASEGSRPRLPWGQQLPAIIQDPTSTLKLLEELKDDSSKYVRISVANHLNDISKDHPDKVITICQSWMPNASSDRRWIIRHACRTLIKSGHPNVFPLLGHTEKPKAIFDTITLNKKSISVGEQITFSFTITSQSEKQQSIVIDYAMHHQKANGKTTAKVFKLKVLKLASGESVLIEKKHSFKIITTRKYYLGEHQIEILMNGVPQQCISFMLDVSAHAYA